MNESLAAYLLQQLTALPYLDGATAGVRAVGLARPYEYSVPNGEETRRVKVPLPVSFTASECEQDSRFLLPDQLTTSILFFEDGGTTSLGAGRPAYERTFESTLQLRLWLNPAFEVNPTTELALVADLYNALQIGQRQQASPLVDLLLSWTIQPAGAALFGAYSYAGETPLLYSPYRVFGAELKASYRFNPACPLETDLPANDRFNYTLPLPLG